MNVQKNSEKFSFFSYYLPSSNVGLAFPRTYSTNCSYGTNACRGARDYGPEHYMSSYAGIHECGQQNVRAFARENTEDKHPVPGSTLKSLTPPEIEPGLQS